MVSAFVADLETIQANLVPAWNGPDFAALRANSHVLIALSGTIGDAPLHSLAQHLNAIAHAQDVTGVKELRSETMAKTAALIEELRIIQTLSGT